jgi:hypothetical protein
MIHGDEKQADETVFGIERDVHDSTGEELEQPDDTIELEQRQSTGFVEIARTMFGR